MACETLAKRAKAIPGVSTIITNACRYVAPGKVLDMIRKMPSRASSYYTKPCYQWGLLHHHTWKSVASKNCK